MRTLGLALVVLIASACTSLGMGPDGSPVGCPLATAEGTLKMLPPDKLLLHTDADELLEIRWSTELTVRPGPLAELVDTEGRVVARAGDRVSIAGGQLDGRGTFTECGGVRVLPRAS